MYTADQLLGTLSPPPTKKFTNFPKGNRKIFLNIHGALKFHKYRPPVMLLKGTILQILIAVYRLWMSCAG